jgi:hypothetical protein
MLTRPKYVAGKSTKNDSKKRCQPMKTVDDSNKKVPKSWPLGPRTEMGFQDGWNRATRGRPKKSFKTAS